MQQKKSLYQTALPFIFLPISVLTCVFVVLATVCDRVSQPGFLDLAAMTLAWSALTTAATAWIFHRALVAPLNRILRSTDSAAGNATIGVNELSLLESRLQRLISRLEEATEREQAIADYSFNVICSIDKNGKILAVNPAVLREWNYLPEELFGRYFGSLTPQEDLERTLLGLEQAQNSRSTTVFENRIKTKAGEIQDVSWTVEWSETDQVLCCIAENISARKQLERVKQDFTSMISHDLKSPLNSLQLLLEMLESGVYGQLAPEAAKLVNISSRSVNRLVALIGQLLDLDKIEAGKFKLQLEQTSLLEVLERSSSEVLGLATEKDLSIVLPNEDALVVADTERLVQVVVNFLSNAIKFSPNGQSILLSVKTAPDWVELRVKDHGSGIPADKLEMIFDRFSQISRADATERRGTGLGLAICKSLIEAHHGQIGVESSPGEGSAFWFRIPRAI